MSIPSKPYQPQARMIREGIQRTLADATYGPLLTADLLAALGVVSGGGAVSLAALKQALIADLSSDALDVAAILTGKLLQEIGAEPVDHLIVADVQPTVDKPYPVPLQRDPGEPADEVLGQVFFGRWTADLPAAGFVSPSGGPAWSAVTATTPPFEAYGLPNSGAPTLYALLTPPRSMAKQPFRVQLRSTHATSATSGITWLIAAAIVPPGGAIGSATFGAEVAVNHTCVAGAYALQVTSESPLITPGGTWTSDGSLLVIRVRRDTAAAGDTLAQTVLFLGATAHFDRAAFTDTPSNPTGIVVTSATITPPASRLVGQSYVAVVDANGPGYTIQWTRDGIDIPGAVGESHAPVDPGRIGFKVLDTDGVTVLATAATVWARKISIVNSTPNVSETAFSIGADHPNKKLYILVEGTRASGATEFHLTLNGATSGYRVGSTVWSGTAFLQVYAIDNPGTTIDIAPGAEGASLSNTVLGLFECSGFEHATATDLDVAAQLASNATSSSITNTNSAYGLILTMGRGYPTLSAPSGFPILYADAANHFGGGNPAAANTDRTFTGSRTGSAQNKILGVVSFAPLSDV